MTPFPVEIGVNFEVAGSMGFGEIQPKQLTFVTAEAAPRRKPTSAITLTLAFRILNCYSMKKFTGLWGGAYLSALTVRNQPNSEYGR